MGHNCNHSCSYKRGVEGNFIIKEEEVMGLISFEGGGRGHDQKMQGRHL